ncbi:multidrug efflux MFS transporter MdtH [Kosakonia radicincitans]|uniref:multidrug efflux MFS transporter MdtH n=1 Tax=Kosakonia radicincitans TaxID=283686 RepID=UPI0005C315C7|nr:multidrug efflux MFS transporter MdtH [Kosakonia radicincitans]KIS44662.1 major Facilitator Superfamily protein [Kosakonia radicincitans YD4]
MLPVTTRARRAGKRFLLLDNMLLELGFSAVFPLLSVHFVEQLGWPAVVVGGALAIWQFIQSGTGILGGAIADRLGAKPTLVVGLLLRALGFAVMGVADAGWILMLGCALAALGGMLFSPCRSALVVKLVRPGERGRFYSILMVEDSAFRVTGALLGSWLLMSYDFRHVCMAGTVFFILAAGWNAWKLPAYKLSSVRAPVLAGMALPLRDRHFRRYVLTLTGYYILNAQVMLMLPIAIQSIAHTPAAVSWMYSVDAIMAVTLLYPMARWSERHFLLERRLTIGLGIMTVSLLCVGFTHTLTPLFALVIVFYLGSLIAEPARETLSAELSNYRARGSYMGFSRMGAAVGGAIGYSGGGWLHDLGSAQNLPALPWLILGIIGFGTLLAIHLQFRRHPTRSIIRTA